MRLKFSCLAAMLILCAVLLLAARPVAAQGDYPNKPINVIVPFEAGAQVDTITRVIAKHAAKYLGQSLVIINKPGAGGQTGWNELMREPADGYTLAATVIPNVIYQPMLRNAGMSGYTFEDFEHIATLAMLPDALAVAKDGKFKTIEDVIAAARQRKGGVTLGIPAVRSDPHAFALMLAQAENVEFNIIPETGGAALVKSVMGGHLDAGVSNLGFLAQNAENLRILAVASEQRDPMLPDVPTFKEKGIDIVTYLTRGMAARKGTPEPIMKLLREKFAEIAKDPEFVKDMKAISVEPTYLDAKATEALGREIQAKTWIIDIFKQQ